MYEFWLDSTGGMTKGLRVATRPAIIPPEIRRTVTQVDGRDGVLVSENSLGPITISLSLSFVTFPEDYNTRVSEVSNWIRKATRLELSDDKEVYYKIVYADVKSLERVFRRGARFTASFICEPYRYRLTGEKTVTVDKFLELFNQFEIAHPVYVFEKSQTLKINGTPIKVVVPSGLQLFVDTDRMMTYTTAGLANTCLTGDYEDLWMQSGTNTLEGNFTLIPNWRSL